MQLYKDQELVSRPKKIIIIGKKFCNMFKIKYTVICIILSLRSYLVHDMAVDWYWGVGSN